MGETLQREILCKTKTTIEVNVQLPQWVGKGSPFPKKHDSQSNFKVVLTNRRLTVREFVEDHKLTENRW